MKRLFIIAIAFFCLGFLTSAQELMVRIDGEDQMDLRGHTRPRYDINNQRCAVVLVAAPDLKDIKFSNVVGEVAYDAPVYEMYVPEGTKRIQFQHEMYIPGVINFAVNNIEINGGSTYKVTILKPDERNVASQFLVFNLTPKNALVELDGEILNNNAGVAMKLVRMGAHRYRVFAPGFSTMDEVVTVSDPQAKTVVDVTLSSSIGKIIVGRDNNPSIDGASIFIDNQLMPDKAPCVFNDVPTGRHIVRIVNQLYAPFEQEVDVKVGDGIELNPTLKPKFVRVKVIAPEGATIRVNGADKGVGEWEGVLSPGLSLFEAVVENAVVFSESQDLQESGYQKVIYLMVSNGALAITSSVMDAEVAIDGIPVGKTPLNLDGLPAGDHVVTLNKEGFSAVTRKVTVIGNQRVDLYVDMHVSDDMGQMLSQSDNGSFSSVASMWEYVRNLRPVMAHSIKTKKANVSSFQVLLQLNSIFGLTSIISSLEELTELEEIAAMTELYCQKFQPDLNNQFNRLKYTFMQKQREMEHLKAYADVERIMSDAVENDPTSWRGIVEKHHRLLSAALNGDNAEITIVSLLNVLNLINNNTNSISSTEEVDYLFNIVDQVDKYNDAIYSSKRISDLSSKLRKELKQCKNKL